MKFALIFLMAFVAVSQQFYLQRPNIPIVWLAPHPAARFFLNNYQPLVAFVSYLIVKKEFLIIT
jgi:hypothetical protein